MISCGLFSLASLFVCILIKAHPLDWDAGSFLIWGLLIAGITAGCGLLLRHLQHRMELEKAVAYAGEERTITADMVEKVLTVSLETSIFWLVDALGQRCRSKALPELQALLEKGENPFGIFAMMLRQFRLIFRAKAGLREGMSKGQIAQILGVQPFIAEKAAEQSKRFSFAELERAIELFCEKDLAMKSGAPYRQVLEDLLIALGS